MEKALGGYNQILDKSVAAEQARYLLPQAAVTESIWTGSLFAFIRTCKERLPDDAQPETSEVAEDLARTPQKVFPHSRRAWLPRPVPAPSESNKSESSKEEET